MSLITVKSESIAAIHLKEKARISRGLSMKQGEKMQRSWNYYVMLVKRWIWVILLGTVVCGTGTYLITKIETPIYQASAVIVVNVSPTTSANALESIAAAPTYAQIVTNPSVLQPVLVRHSGLTLQQLTAMLTVTAPTNTQLVEIDVQNSDPQLAAQLANEISQSFVQYVSTQLPGALQVLPAQLPTVPIKPRPLQDSSLGALIGLGLAIALIAVFEWLDNRLRSPEEVQQALDLEVLAVIPYIARRKDRRESFVEEPALIESYRSLCATLNAEQARNPFKLIMVTSALVGEGKSSIAANIASFLSMTGKRVLLVDADLHRPVQAQQFQLDNYRGFSRVFMEMPSQNKWLLNGQATSVPTLRVLTSGALPANPAELLQSALGQQLFTFFREEAPFDYVIFDTPPLLPLADAKIVASFVHAVILVADVDKTSRKTLLQATHILKRTHTLALGVVINKCQWPEYRKLANPNPRDEEQAEVDTSLIMYPGAALPAIPMPQETPLPRKMIVPSHGPRLIIRSPGPFAERVNQAGPFRSHPQSRPQDRR